MLFWLCIYLWSFGGLTIFTMAAKAEGVATFGTAFRAGLWPIVFPVIALGALFSAIWER